MDPSVQEQQASAFTIPAPIGGWNTKDALIDMPETDAIRLENMFPDTNSVNLRRGFSEHADCTEDGNIVETMMEYLKADGTRKLMAVSDLEIFDVTTSTVTTEDLAAAGTALANNSRLSWINFNNNLIFCNGEDEGQYYNGTNWQDIAWTGPTDDVKFVHVNAYKQRLYFVENDTEDLWYGTTSGVAGVAATKLPLGDVLQFGGPLLYSLTWSYDSGAGIEQMLVVVSQSGEVIIYGGSYPGDVATWSKITQFVIPRPLGRRSYAYFGSDILIATVEGVFSIAQIMSAGANTTYATISDKINKSFQSAGRLYYDGTVNADENFGFDVQLYPRSNMLLFNIPTSVSETGTAIKEATNISSDQYVMNTITGAWCRFTGMNAGSWIVSGDVLYFGGRDGIVYKADTGSNDNGTSISTNIKTAFTFGGDRMNSKRFTLAKPVIYGDPGIEFVFDIDVDFADTASTDTITVSGTAGSAWDTEDWDAGTWGSGQTTINEWYTINGYGKAVSCKLEANFLNVSFQLSAINLSYETGGIL